MLHRLIDCGYPVVQEERYPPGCLYHQYLVIMLADQELIIDPTWQQFLPPGLRTPDKPKVLISTPDKIIDLATEYGVPSNKSVSWERRNERWIRDLEKAPTVDDTAALLTIYQSFDREAAIS